MYNKKVIAYSAFCIYITFASISLYHKIIKSLIKCQQALLHLLFIVVNIDAIFLNSCKQHKICEQYNFSNIILHPMII